MLHYKKYKNFVSNSDIDFMVSFVFHAKITFFDLEEMEKQLGELCDRPIDIVAAHSTY